MTGLKAILKRKWRVVAALLLGVAAPLFFQLGGRGLNEPDEGRYSEIGREMLVTGDWLMPRLNGVPHYAKPPWIYWCVASSLKLFGINEWAARLPSALAAAATALMVFALGRRMGGALAGLVSAMVLTGSLLFFMVGRLITPDMMLTAFITTGFYCFWRWWTSPERPSRWLLGFYLTLALAFLDKGPVALAVCFLAITGFLLASRNLRDFPKLCWMRGLLLVALIALPWFLILCSLNHDLYNFYLVGEVKDRVLSGRGRVKSWYYFFWVLPIACWPWTALAVGAVWRHFQAWRRKEKSGVISAFLLSWVAFPFILFTVSSSKLPTYILPLMPPISLLVGIWLARKMTEDDVPMPSWAQGATWAFLPAFVAVPWVLTHRTQPSWTPLWLALAAGMAAVCGTVFRVMRSRTPQRTLVMRFAAWWLLSMGLLQGIVWQANRFEEELRHNSSWRSLARSLDGIDLVGVPIVPGMHPTGKKPEFARSGPRVVMYEFFCRSCSFYLMKGRPEVVPLFGGDSLWEIARDHDADVCLTREDLAALLKGDETVYVFTRPQYHQEMREMTRMELPLIRSAGSGDDRVVLFSNGKNS